MSSAILDSFYLVTELGREDEALFLAAVALETQVARVLRENTRSPEMKDALDLL